MDKNIDRNFIDQLLTILPFPLLCPIRKFEDGYEVMLDMTEKQISKKELRAFLNSKSIPFSQVDTLRDTCGSYAYLVLKCPSLVNQVTQSTSEEEK